eukprot:scaffold262445_cov35-Tisochrysis_lutea.AAC.2
MCDVVHFVRVALWRWLAPWLADTWAGVNQAGGRCVCVASVRSWSVGAAGWAEKGWERGALHAP